MTERRGQNPEGELETRELFTVIAKTLVVQAYLIDEDGANPATVAAWQNARQTASKDRQVKDSLILSTRLFHFVKRCQGRVSASTTSSYYRS